MKKVLSTLALVIAFTIWTPAYAQTGPTGAWRVEGTGPSFPWEVVLRPDGPTRVIGAVSSCSSVPGAFEISLGRVDGNTITFQCKSGDLQRTISFTGTITRDEIVFTWQKEVREGGRSNPDEAMFGLSAPPRFTAKRVPSATTVVAQAADRARRTITFDRILGAAKEPQNWLTYSGNLLGLRHSALTQITPENVKNLEPAWVWQAQSNVGAFEATSLAVDGVLYTVQNPNTIVALDAVSGTVLWSYLYEPGPDALGGYGRINRGLAILNDTLFIGTLDAHLIAVNTYTGKLVWDAIVSDSSSCKNCYGITGAPLVVKDKVIVGLGSGDKPIRGAIAAFDAATGKEVWRFTTVPARGEAGNDTWSGDSWRTGGVGVWNTGSYDADLNLTYWGTGNPYPIENPNARLGDNLYGNSVVALDADSGALKWHYQFTPHDVLDWDATQVPVLTDLQWQGRLRKVMLWANRNGLMYVLDRATGQFLLGKPFVEVNWLSSFDEKGRPVPVPGRLNGLDIATVRPLAGFGGTNWEPPSYSPVTGLFYIPALDVSTVTGATPADTQNAAYGAIRAFDPLTGERKWEFRPDKSLLATRIPGRGTGSFVGRFAGLLTTASGLLFTGVGDAYFYALDARTGERLWQMPVPGRVYNAPMTYSVNGTQYILIAAGNTLFAFALRQ